MGIIYYPLLERVTMYAGIKVSGKFVLSSESPRYPEQRAARCIDSFRAIPGVL